MNVIIVKRTDGKAFNRNGQQVIDCIRGCGCKTLATVGVCDYCMAAEQLQTWTYQQLSLPLQGTLAFA